jgi:hypothetical protein
MRKLSKTPTKAPANNLTTPNKRIVICLPEEYLHFNFLIGEAIYLYLWCIYCTTSEYAADAHGRRIGLICRGAPVTDTKIAGELGCSAKTIQRWRKKLEEHRLIRTDQVGRGIGYTVLDSYKYKPEDVKSDPPPDWTLVSSVQK